MCHKLKGGLKLQLEELRGNLGENALVERAGRHLTSTALETLKGHDSVGVGWGCQDPENTEGEEAVLMPDLARAPNTVLIVPFL